MAKANCSVCGTSVETRLLANPQKLEDEIVSLIRNEHPDWDGKHGVCPKCREQYRAKKFLGYLEAEYTKISDLEKNLVTKIARRGQIAKKVNDEFEKEMTTGERIADRVAQFGGSWTFIILFGGILAFWVFVNTVPLLTRAPFDPFPYIFLNLVLSMVAALQAPVIMMSQNRQSSKDRLQAQNDYEINLMAEMEIRDLHDKFDGLRLKAWHELWQLQQQQIKMLETVIKHLTEAHQPPAAPSAIPETGPSTS
ncbi:MAG: DUF1003 domain-containing protein [Terriglobia bacterium]